MATKPKQSSVQLATFLKWGFESFRYETTESDGRINVTKIWCKVCEEHIDRIKADDKFRGQALKDIETFVKGSTFVTKYTAERHLGSKVGLQVFQGNKLW